MSNTEYGLRKRATRIAAQRKSEQIHRREVMTTAVATALAATIMAKAEQEIKEEFEPEHRPNGLRGVVYDAKQTVGRFKKVIRRD